MQALVSDGRMFHCSVFRAQEAHGSTRSLKGRRGETVFPGRKQAGWRHKLSCEPKRAKKEAFFAYFLSRKKVSAFSSVGRATDS